MYHRYNGTPNGRYSVEAILVIGFTELACLVSHVLPLAAIFSNTVNTMEGNGNS